MNWIKLTVKNKQLIIFILIYSCLFLRNVVTTSRIWLIAVLLSRNDLIKLLSRIGYAYVIELKQNGLLPAKGQWCSVAGKRKITAGLA